MKPERGETYEPVYIAFPFLYALFHRKLQFSILRSYRQSHHGLICCHYHGYPSLPTLAIGHGFRTDYNQRVFHYTPPNTQSFLMLIPFGQSLYRRVQRDGLQNEYQDPADNTVRKFSKIKKLVVPISDVATAFELLQLLI